MTNPAITNIIRDGRRAIDSTDGLRNICRDLDAALNAMPKPEAIAATRYIQLIYLMGRLP